MKICGIYKIESVIKPQKHYVGSAFNIYERWQQHLSLLRRNKHGNSKLQNHYNKYGKDDLVFSIIIECDKEDLIKKEQFYIDGLNPWFNICKIANNCLGVKRSAETCKRLGLWQKGIKHGPMPMWVRIKMSNAAKGKKMSVEVRAKISNTLKGQKLSEERKKKISAALTGKKLTYSQKGKKVSKETCLKISKALTGKKRKPLSESTKQKISKAMMGNIPWNKKNKNVA